MKLNTIPQIPKFHQTIWYICRALLFIWGTVMLFSGYTVEFLEGMTAIMLTFLWDIFQLFGGKSLITLIPYKLQTTVAVLACLYVVVGSTVNKFTTFEHVDVPEHFLSGFVAAEGSYILATIIQIKHKRDKSPITSLSMLFAFGFSVMILTLWEFYEFSMDRIFGLFLQRSVYNSEEGLIDTMVDLLLGAGGALLRLLLMGFTSSDFFKEKVSKLIKRKETHEQKGN